MYVNFFSPLMNPTGIGAGESVFDGRGNGQQEEDAGAGRQPSVQADLHSGLTGGR